uniref:Uncharacterized protein n=1 Tax=Callorhinchus milii TaxID=7868 RepID=A0A4W3JE51_CALMI
MPFRRMKDSYVEVYLPLGTQPQLRKMYLNVFNCVRCICLFPKKTVLIAYLHTKNEEYSRTPLLIITALVEKIDLQKKTILPDSDIKFTGNVTWVGSSSIEVLMHMSQVR